MANPRKQAQATRELATDGSNIPLEDELLSMSERRNIARAAEDRAAGRFLPLREALDVARRTGSRRGPRTPARRSR